MRWTTLILLAGATQLMACRPKNDDSNAASIEAAKSGDQASASLLDRAPERGKTAQEAAEYIMKTALPDELMRFYDKDLGAVLKWGSVADVAKKCEELTGSAGLGACWEFVGDDKSIALHVADGSPELVHSYLPEAAFAGFFEGVVAEMADNAKSAKVKLKELLATDDKSFKKTLATVNAVFARRHSFVRSALRELEAKYPGTLSTYASTYGGDATPEALAKKEEVVNFLWAELAAAYYANPDENKAFSDLMPDTYYRFSKVAKHMGKAWWDY
jgi:hypothetical protein